MVQKLAESQILLFFSFSFINTINQNGGSPHTIVLVACGENYENLKTYTIGIE